MDEFLLLAQGGYLLQADGVSRIILATAGPAEDTPNVFHPVRGIQQLDIPVRGLTNATIPIRGDL